MLILDSLSMLVTSDPVAEIDTALAETATRLRAAQIAQSQEEGYILAAWIDARLYERLTLQHNTAPTNSAIAGKDWSAVERCEC